MWLTKVALSLLKKNMPTLSGSSLDREWPTTLSEAAGVKRARRHLKALGWMMLPPWPWMNIQIRARRAGVSLNLMVYGSSTLTLDTVVKDLAYDNREKQEVLGVLALKGVAGVDSAANFASLGIFVTGPSGLADIENTIIRTRRALSDAQAPMNITRHNSGEISTVFKQDSDTAKESNKFSGITGRIENVNGGEVWGWAYNTRDPREHLLVEATVDSELLGCSRAATYRKDLQTTGMGEGDHAFLIKLDRCDALDVRKKLVITAISAGGDRLALIGL